MGKKPISMEEIRKRIFDAHGDAVTLKEETYKNTNDLCIFMDKDYGDFAMRPYHVFNGHGHKERGYKIVSEKLSSSRITKTLAESNPEILNEWNFIKNKEISPERIGFKSSKEVWWICSKGHEWQSTIANRTAHGNGCPGCSGRMVTEHNALNSSEVMRDWDYTKNAIEPSLIARGTHDKFNWKCYKCCYEWEASANNRTKPGGSGCEKCAFEKNKLEKFVESKLYTSKFSEKIFQDRKFAPDFKLNEELFLNSDGIYWHSEKRKDKNYHKIMREFFEENRKRILQFYSDEIYNKWPIVESIINNARGKTINKIMARKCEVRAVSQKEMDLFFEINHLMENCHFSSSVGLYYKNELISCLSFNFPKKQKICKIIRFASKLNTIVIGGFQKLLSVLEDVCKHKNVSIIVSFCDLRYATGQSYEKAGFRRVGVTLGFYWTDGTKKYSREYCQAKDGKTEAQVAKEKRVYKIYDAGQAKYMKYIK